MLKKDYIKIIMTKVNSIVMHLPTEKQLNKCNKIDLISTFRTFNEILLVERMTVKKAKRLIGKCDICHKKIKGLKHSDYILLGRSEDIRWHIQGVCK